MGDTSTRRRESTTPAPRAPSPAVHDRRGALVQLDLLVRAHPDPQALLEGLQALLERGELTTDDLPAVEATLMGLVGPRRPAADPAKPSHVAALPPEEQARLRALMQADLDHLAARADETWLSADDERDVGATFERWVALDEQQGLGGSLLDQFLGGLGDRRLTRGPAGAVTNALDELKRRMSPEGRARLIRALSKGRALGHLALQPPTELPGVWRDVLVKTGEGLPGGAASFAGGALQSLPTEVAERAGAWLQGQGYDSLKAHGYSDDDAGDVVAAGGAAGRVWGEGMQLVAGLGALGEAAKLGNLAKLGVTGARAAEVAETLQGVVGLAEQVNELLTVKGPLLVGAFKVFTDLLKKAAAGQEITPADVSDALASRAVKELLSALGAGDTKDTAGKAFAERKEHSIASNEALDRAATHSLEAKALHAHADDERDRPDARSIRLSAVEHESLADGARDRANAEKRAARSSIATYLLYTVVQRLFVNLAAVLTHEVARSAVARREDGTSQAALAERIRSRLGEVVRATVREVATDVLTRLIFQEAEAFKAAPKVLQDSVRLGLDGVTKVVAGYLERLWSLAIDG